MKLRGDFEVVSWEEEAYQEHDDRKLTQATVGQSFAGDLGGTGEARWLMAYRSDGTARFVGIQMIETDVEGHLGTLVFETSGDFDGQTARWVATVVDGAGSGELADASGGGRFEAPLGSKATFELDLELRAS